MPTEEGMDCTTAQDVGHLNVSDEEQLTFAAAAQHILVTFDCRDFQIMAARWQEAGRSHAGIILTKSHPLHDWLPPFPTPV
jgi:hypothetical protein